MVVTDLHIIVLVIALFSLFIIFEYTTKQIISRLRYSNVVFSEFPKIEKSSLPRFTSFDPELGWERQPNEQRKKDTGHQRPDNSDAENTVYSTDEYASRVCKVERDSGDFSITTFGDSYCFCRDVNDNETIQHYLLKELGVHVSNYGVGNYGLDQSILRMKKRFDDDPADYVVLILSDQVAINRIVSSWKHYFEFGNTFAVKPRFRLENGDLQKIPTPIEKKQELLSLENHAEYLRSNDYHYGNWFLPRFLNRPYSSYWVQNRTNTPYALSTILEYPVRNRPTLEPIHRRIKPVQSHWAEKKSLEKWEYRINLEKEFSGLFCALLREFSEYVRLRNAVPIFLPVRHPKVHQMEFDPIGELIISRINDVCPQLHVVDPRDEIVEEANGLGDLCVKSESLGGHPSPTHNQLNAKHLGKFIEKRRK